MPLPDAPLHPEADTALTPPQLVEAAEKAGVDRRTIHRWRKEDPEFIAALNGVLSETAHDHPG